MAVLMIMCTILMKLNMKRNALILVLLTLAVVATTSAQMVEVDPPRPVLYSKTRTTEIVITNPANKPVDVRLNFEYTTLRGDSVLGNRLIDSGFTEEEKSKDCSGWLKVFPRRMVIPGRGSRTVRVLASIPQGISDGEYSARIVMDCELQNAVTEIPALDTAQNDVSMAAAMSTVLSLPVAVRVGKFETGIQLESVTTKRDTLGQTYLLCGLQRTGNSPYRGTMQANFIKMSERDTAVRIIGMTIEFNAWVPVVPPKKLSDGEYRVELSIASTRGGSFADLMIPVPTITRTYRLSINGEVATLQEEN
jgi:hypothetical protein